MESPTKQGEPFSVIKGGLEISGSESQSRQTDPESEVLPPKSPPRGKAREYSQAFETAWKLYGRREEKFEAYGIWLIRSREAGGQAELLALVKAALSWQSANWENDGWKFAPYFSRYLKRRKWEDEQPAHVAVQRTDKNERTITAAQSWLAKGGGR